MNPKEKFDAIKKAHEEGGLVTVNSYLVQFNEITLNRFDTNELQYAVYFDQFKSEPLDFTEYSTIKKYRVSNQKI